MNGTETRYRLVVQLARELTARRDLDDVLTTTLRGLRQLLQFSGGSIQLLDDEGYIRLAATDPPATDDVRSLRIPLGGSVGGRILLTEQPIYVRDILADPLVPHDRQPKQVTSGVRSYFGVPLLAEGHAIGLIQIDGAEVDQWSAEERLLVLSIAPVVAAAIQNARAHAVERAATERLADVESQHAEAVRILDEQLREPAAALARDTAHAAAQLARDPVAAAEMLGRVHETALAIAESIVGLAYVLQAQSRALLEPRTPAHAKPVREPVVTRKR